MRNRNIMAAFLAGGLSLVTTQLQAQDATAASPPPAAQPGSDSKSEGKPSTDAVTPPTASQAGRTADPAATRGFPACNRASHIIGMELRTEMGDRLGRVQDLIVSLDSDRAPFAIVHYGGALGLGGTRVAVPLKELRWAADRKSLTIGATRDQFTSASTTPSGAWAEVANQDWAQDIDRFYGQPSTLSLSRYERQEMDGTKEGHEFVRSPIEEKGADGLMNQNPPTDSSGKPAEATHPDSEIAARVNELIGQTVGDTTQQDVQASVEKGVVTLKGKVISTELQRKIENQVAALPGVQRVDDRLSVSPKAQ
jgi:osmotically-inducible protein OsmY